MMRDTLGEFISAEIQRRNLSNRELAHGAGVSEAVIRNLRMHGVDPRAKDPDPRTLRAVADYLGINALTLFRLAGYIPPERDAFSIRAEFLAYVFDQLRPDQQDAVMGVIESFAKTYTLKEQIEAIRNPSMKTWTLEGFDLNRPEMVRQAANLLIKQTDAQTARELDVPKVIPPDIVVIPGSAWSELPESTRRRVLALAKAKLNLSYDPTMVDPEWRK